MPSDSGLRWGGVRGGPVVRVLDCQSRGLGFKSRPWQKLSSRFLLPHATLANQDIWWVGLLYLCRGTVCGLTLKFTCENVVWWLFFLTFRHWLRKSTRGAYWRRAKKDWVRNKKEHEAANTSYSPYRAYTDQSMYIYFFTIQPVSNALWFSCLTFNPKVGNSTSYQKKGVSTSPLFHCMPFSTEFH